MRNYWCYLLDRNSRRLKVAEFACANDDEAIAAARLRFAEYDHLVDANCGTTLGFYGSLTAVSAASNTHVRIALRAYTRPNNRRADFGAI